MKLTLIRGDDHTISLKFWNGDVVQDITGWTVFFTIKEDADNSDDDAILKKNITSHTNPTQGETEITITDEDCDSLEGLYYYDIQYKDDSGNIKTVLNDVVIFTKDITRRIA